MKLDGPQKNYWQANLIVIGVLLAIWAVVSFGCSVLFVETLNQFRFYQVPLGYWIANQGAMVVFVGLILVYAIASDILERRYLRQRDAQTTASK